MTGSPLKLEESEEKLRGHSNALRSTPETSPASADLVKGTKRTASGLCPGDFVRYATEDALVRDQGNGTLRRQEANSGSQGGNAATEPLIDVAGALRGVRFTATPCRTCGQLSDF